MKRILLLLLLISIPKFAYGIAYTSAANGNWSNVATWGGGGFPGAGDTATILSAHTVTVDGNISVGTSPSGIITYDLDISGILEWPANPGAGGDWTMTVSSSIAVRNGGSIRTSGNLNCSNKARITLDTNGNPKYRIVIFDGGTFDIRGCEGYTNSTGTIERARISSCSAAPCTGAVTLTLDRDVNWNTCNADATYCSLIIGNGGNALTAPGGRNSEFITSYTRVGANQISLNLANTHLEGDFVAKTTRNFLIDSNSNTTHGYIYSDGGEYYLEWMRINEMGDTTTTTAALVFNNVAKSLGTLNHIAITNADDGGGVAGLYVRSSSYSIDHVYIYDAYYGVNIASGGRNQEITNIVVTNEGAYGQYGFYAPSTNQINTYSGFWISQYTYATCSYISHFTDCLIHDIDWYGIYIMGNTSYYANKKIYITDNEIRNITGAFGTGIYGELWSAYIANNDIDNCYNACLSLSDGEKEIEAYNNTYDACNTSNVVNQGAIIILYASGNYYAVGDIFGADTANKYANIVWTTNGIANQDHGMFRGVCNNCTFGALVNPPAGWELPIIPTSPATWQNVVGISYGSYFTYHNEDTIEDDHGGWGPLGMYIERETGTVVDNTLNLKITPGNAIEYGRLEIGSIHLDSGEDLTVQVQLRKTAAQVEGRRPRLSLQGCGFDPQTDYDEMSDVNNTWETVEVTGTATWKGSVHIYVEVKNELNGGNDYQPVWPPTLDVYADGFRYQKS